MPDLSIIILNWNTQDRLVKCLESIFSNAPQCEFEVIVVDNNSEEDIADAMAQFEEVLLIRNDYNYGFAIGNNIGYRASTGRYVMPLNPDTLIYPEAIDRLITELETDNSIGIAVPVVKDTKVRPANYTFAHLYFDSIVYRNISNLFERYRRSVAEPFDVELFSGTGYICRRSALSEDKIFREDHFLFGEEYRLCREMSEKGFKIRIVPDAQIHHFASVTFKDDAERLVVASRLGNVVQWEIRKERLGSILGILTGLILWMEQLLKLIFLRVARTFKTSKQENYRKLEAQSSVAVSSLFPLLKDQSRFQKKVNDEARLYFNGGKEREAPIVNGFADLNA